MMISPPVCFCTILNTIIRRQLISYEMVQKQIKRTRGRPRAYDPEQALKQATNAFWQTGFSGTSLDDLSAATNMNRPSLYGAFGDKRAIYLTTIDHYVAKGFEA